MPAKIIPATNHEDYVPEVKKRTVRKPYIEPEWLIEYKRDRDRIIYKTTKDEQTKQDILDKYGVADKKANG